MSFDRSEVTKIGNDNGPALDFTISSHTRCMKLER